MAAHQARIEEVFDSDSDPSEMDPSEMNPPTAYQSSSLINPSHIPTTSSFDESQAQAQAREKTKHYQCLYPIYFDVLRTHRTGRKVPKRLAVANPLARTIVDAIQSLSIPSLQIAFEPAKTHPRDWANPGRVRVLIKQDGKDMTGGRIKGKHDLFAKVAAYLQQHPTEEDSPLRLRVAGMPVPTVQELRDSKAAVPLGWKMGGILPLHSPALSGGGVNDDFMKDMMSQMPGMEGMASLLGGSSQGSGPVKKEKEKRGKAN